MIGGPITGAQWLAARAEAVGSPVLIAQAPSRSHVGTPAGFRKLASLVLTKTIALWPIALAVLVAFGCGWLQ